LVVLTDDVVGTCDFLPCGGAFSIKVLHGIEKWSSPPVSPVCFIDRQPEGSGTAGVPVESENELTNRVCSDWGYEECRMLGQSG